MAILGPKVATEAELRLWDKTPLVVMLWAGAQEHQERGLHTRPQNTTTPETGASFEGEKLHHFAGTGLIIFSCRPCDISATDRLDNVLVCR